MNRKQRKALEQSIWHWYEIYLLCLAGMWDEASDICDAEHCPLCQANMYSCRQCVIGKHTGMGHCWGTPFDSALFDIEHGAGVHNVERMIHYLETILAGEEWDDAKT